MRVVGKDWSYILFDLAALRSWSALQTMLLCFHWFCCVCISLRAFLVDGGKLNDASLKLFVIYYWCLFTQTPTFFGLWNSENICRQCEHWMNLKHRIELLLDATMLRSRTASPAIFFVWLHICVYLMWCIIMNFGMLYGRLLSLYILHLRRWQLSI